MDVNVIAAKLAKYIAFLRREADIWRQETTNVDRLSYFDGKMDTAIDICTMLGCKDKVLSEASKIYNFRGE